MKYGQIPEDADRNPNKLSITELKFNEAQRLSRPILLFIMGEEHPVKKVDIEIDPEKEAKLDAFRTRAKLYSPGGKVNRVYAVFNSVEDFKHRIASSLTELCKFLDSSDRSGRDTPAPLEKASLGFPLESQSVPISTSGGISAVPAAPLVSDDASRDEERRNHFRSQLIRCLERQCKSEAPRVTILQHIFEKLGIVNQPPDLPKAIESIVEYLMDPLHSTVVFSLNALIAQLWKERADAQVAIIDECMNMLYPIHFDQQAILKAARQHEEGNGLLIQETVTTPVGAEIVFAAIDVQGTRFKPSDPNFAGRYAVADDDFALGDFSVINDAWELVDQIVVTAGFSTSTSRGPIDDKRKAQIRQDLTVLETHKLTTGRTFYCLVRKRENPAENEHVMILFQEVRRIAPLLPIVVLDPDAPVRGTEKQLLHSLKWRRDETRDR